MNRLSIFSFLIIYLVVFLSCKKDDDGPDTDTTPPEATVFSPQPDDVIVIPKGSETAVLHFDALFSDNVELGEFEIDIHEAFDGHDHGKNFAPFNFRKAYDLSGSRDTLTELDISLNDNIISGPYDLTLSLTDMAGNSLDDDGANFINIRFEIINENFGPKWDIESPLSGQQFSHGETIAIRADINGFAEIEELWIDIVHENGETVFSQEKDHIEMEKYRLEEDITIDQPWPAGTYEIKIEIELETGRHYHIVPKLEIEVQ